MHKYFGIGLYVFTLLISVIAASTPMACHTCQQSSRCYPPDCMCCKDLVSTNGTYVKELPQIVYFTFDDAVTSQAAQMYRKLFTADRKNPNGCRIKFTLFISHNYTEYEIVKEFYGQGMEIASHSVNHRSDLSLSQVREEILRQKDNLVRLGNIPKDEVVGWRSPFLKPFGDHQMEILKEGGYLYDSTLTFSKGKRKPIYPFTLDYGWPFHCQIHDCPKKKHPGFWEVPVVSVHDKDAKYDCVYIDGCTTPPNTEEEAYNYLWDNFLNYYNGNRAPMGINMHAAWFFYNYPTDPYRLKAMDRFIQKLVSKRDVHIVTVRQMLDWVKNPVLSSQVNSIKSWQCDGGASSSWGGDLSGKSQQSTDYGNDYVYNRYEQSSNQDKQTKEDFFGLETSLFGSQTPEIFEPIDNKPQNSRSTGSIRKDKPENIFREEEEQARFLDRTKMVEERKDKVARTHQTTRYSEAGRTEAIKRANAQDQANMAREAEIMRREKAIKHAERIRELQAARQRVTQQETTKKVVTRQEYSLSLSEFDPRTETAREKDMFRQAEIVGRQEIDRRAQSRDTFQQLFQRNEVKEHRQRQYTDNQGDTLYDVNKAYVNEIRKQLLVEQRRKIQQSESRQPIVSLDNVSLAKSKYYLHQPVNKNEANYPPTTDYPPAADYRPETDYPPSAEYAPETDYLSETDYPLKTDYPLEADYPTGNYNFPTKNLKWKTVLDNPLIEPPVAAPRHLEMCEQGRNCLLPNCHCMNARLPFSNRKNMPQFVYFTFDGAIDINSYNGATSLFDVSRLNPNGCPIKATFFVSDIDTRYNLVRELYKSNMDIGLHGNSSTFYDDENIMASDIRNQKVKMVKQAHIPLKDIIGWRSPSMQPLGDAQMEILQKERFIYDATLIHKTGFQTWTFTLDFGWERSWSIGQCPTRNFNGLWEVPTIPLLDHTNYTCVYADGCLSNPVTEKETLNFLWKNMAIHYPQKIAIGIRLQHDWFHWSHNANLKGLNDFILDLLDLSDVYIVSIRELIQWMKSPKTLQEMRQSPC